MGHGLRLKNVFDKDCYASAHGSVDLITPGAPLQTGPRPPAINARVEKVATGAFWREAWNGGRGLVPADGWYEWKPVPGTKHKPPYYFRLKGGGPLFFPAIGHLTHHGREIQEGDGFATITMAADGGMAEIHDRRPLVLGPDEARAWLDPHLLPAEAEEIALHHGLPTEAFEWFPVGHEVGSVNSEGAGLIAPRAASIRQLMRKHQLSVAAISG